HEIDHLDGTLFIDHLSRLKQSLIRRKAEKRVRLGD
ncbi:peptide deformylase, partial [Acidithiobacillus ferrooxidans]|nr:peptide deformylase [Acidithiobacillus ferrooxidans]